ncbi:Hypothetical predicted protein [Paramuricea clavata]|uniref:Uncharacterized protein n=1 Tax=Paramuricea clavata TaxID=317549 RepID=A0A6S7JD38_PARCT|nr:Hypothetical predicted protein [Paramuricea clavata]
MEKHSNETLLCLKKLSVNNKSKIGQANESVNYVSSDFEVTFEDILLTLHCRNAQDAAKLFGVYLYHRGLLCSYEKGSNPKIVSVMSVDMNVKFNTWYHKKSDVSVEFIVEAIYTKMVCGYCKVFP